MTRNPDQSNPIRILAIHRYFWPDTPPYASMLKSITTRWASDGHSVEVFSTQPCYKPNSKIPPRPTVETVDNVRISRINLPKETTKGGLRNILNVARFFMGTFLFVLRRPRFDLIMCSTAPPVLVGVAARWGAKLTGAKFIYHCMDIHPEIGKLSGDFQNKVIYNILLKIDSKNCNRASAVVVLSKDMRDSILRRPNCKKANIIILNNFSLPEFNTETETVVDDDWLKKSGVFRLIFTGNLGRFQGLESFVDAMHLLPENTNIEMVFVGEGKALAGLVDRAGVLSERSIRFFPHQPIGLAKELIRNADMGVVSLMSEIIRYAYPSKMMTYLEEGKPVCVSITEDCELSNFVLSNGIGICVPQNDPALIANAIQNLTNSSQCFKMSANVGLLDRTAFDKEVVLDQWSNLISGLTQSVSIK